MLDKRNTFLLFFYLHNSNYLYTKILSAFAEHCISLFTNANKTYNDFVLTSKLSANKIYVYVAITDQSLNKLFQNVKYSMSFNKHNNLVVIEPDVFSITTGRVHYSNKISVSQSIKLNVQNCCFVKQVSF